MVLSDWLVVCRETLSSYRPGTQPLRRAHRQPKTLPVVGVESLEARQVLSPTSLANGLYGVVLATDPGVTPTSPAPAAGTDREDARFDPSFQWISTASGAGPFGVGDPRTLTWSIAPDKTLSDDGIGSTLKAFLNSAIGSSGATTQAKPWFPIFNDSFERIEALSGLTFTFENADDGAAMTGPNKGVLGTRGDLRILGHTLGASGSGILAYNYFPDFGDMVINTDFNTFYSNSANSYLGFRNVVTHEFGHGVALRHVESADADFLMEPVINLNFDGPQFDDILGLHRGYGDAREKLGGNSIATAINLGSLTVSAPIAIGTNGSVTTVLPTETDFVSIDDESDIDIYKFKLAGSSSVTLTLTPQGPTYLEGPQGGSQSTFNTAAQSDLTLTLISADGTTVLRTANAGTLGATESIANLPLNGGDYFVRITGSSLDKVQMYKIGLSAVDTTPPVADIVDVTPDPRGAAVAAVTINFDEDVTGVDITDFRLTRDSIAVSLTGLAVTAVSPVQYTIDLSTVTGATGSYALTLRSSGSSIRNESGLFLQADVTDSWANDLSGPTADLIDVTPDPRTTSVASVTITFNEPVTGVNATDFSLTRNGVSISLANKVVTTINASQYVIPLSGLTDLDGVYVLTLNAQNSGIKDAVGNLLAVNASDSFKIDTTGPLADIIDLTPDPRAISAGTVTVQFDEPVTGVTISDFSLTRNGTAINLSGVNLTAATTSQYTLDLGLVTVLDGTYVLSLIALGSGIADEALNAMTVDATETWLLESVAPVANIIPVTPDPRNTNVGVITINFSEPVTGVNAGDFVLTRGGQNVPLVGVTLTAITPAKYELDLTSVTGQDGSYVLTLVGVTSGIFDLAGNVLSANATESFLIDAIPPTSFVLIDPAGGVFLNNNAPTFDWSNATDANALTYRLQIATDAGFSNVVRTRSGIAASTYTLTGAEQLADADYFWRVIGIDSTGNQTLSQTAETFTIDTVAPNSFDLIAPDDQFFTDTLTPTFDWTDSADSRTAVDYELDVATDANFSTIVFTKTGLTASTYTVLAGEALANEVTHFWRVRAFDVVGNSTQVGPFEFTPDTTPPRIQVSLLNGNLSVYDLPFGSGGRSLEVSINGANLRFHGVNATDQIDAFTGATQIDNSTVEVPLADITGNVSIFLSIDPTDTVAFTTDVALTSNFVVVKAGQTIFRSAAFSATGLIDFQSDLILDSASVTISSNLIYFGSTIDSAAGQSNNLTVNASATIFVGDVGSNDPIGQLTTDAAGNTGLTGNVFLNGATSVFGDNVVLLASVAIDQAGAGDVTFASSVESNGGSFNLTVNTAGGSTNFQGAVGADSLGSASNDAGLGRSIVVENLNLASTTLLALDLGGTAAGAFDVVTVTGTVDLDDSDLDLDVTYAPAVNDSFTIIANDDADSVSGTFLGLTEGASFTANGYVFQITYSGGDGNDVVATVLGQVTVSFESSASTVGEEDGAGQVVTVVLNSLGVTLTEPLSIDVVGATGAAGDSTDYSGSSTLTFGVGSADGATQSVTIVPINDALVEGNEIAGLELQNAIDVIINSAAQTHDVTIDDNDSATLTIDAATTVLEASGSQAIVVTLTTSDGAGGTATLAPGISLSASIVDLGSGTATSDADYTATISLSVTFAAGSISGATESALLGVLNDALVEGNETVILGLSNLNAPLDGQASLAGESGTLTIDDNDTATLSIDAVGTLSEEGGGQIVTVTLTTSDGAGGFATLANNVTLSADVVDATTGSAKSGADYSDIGTQTISFSAGDGDGATVTATIDVSNDALVEGNESLNLTLQNLASDFDGQVALVATASTLRIDDNDTATFSIDASRMLTEEDGIQSIFVTLTTSDGAGGTATLASAITLTADVIDLGTGTATNGTDYSLFGTQTVTFDAGSGNDDIQSVTLTPLNDTLIEGNEIANLRLQNLSSTLNGQAALGNTASVVTIDDNDIATLSIAPTVTALEQGGAKTVTITLSTSVGAVLAPGVTLTADVIDIGTGTATSGLDYAVFGARTVSFGTGSVNGSIRTVLLDVRNDSLIEGNESVHLGLVNLSTVLGDQASIGDAFSTVTIDDNDLATIVISSGALVDEGASATFDIQLRTSNGEGGLATIAPGVSITVGVADSGNGTATTDDYATGGTQTVTFDAGNGYGTLRRLSLSTIDDNLLETRETVALVLEAVLGESLDGQVTLGSGATVAIVDNETAVIEFVTASTLVAEIAGTHSLEVVLHATDRLGGPAVLAPGVSLSVGVTDLGGNPAIRGLDYNFAPLTLVFAPGDADGKTLPVSFGVRGDSLIEGNETAKLRLQNLSSSLNGLVSIGQQSLFSIAIDDNDTAVLALAASTVVSEVAGNRQIAVVLTTSNGEGGTARIASGVVVSAQLSDLQTGTAQRRVDYGEFTVQSVTFSVGDGNGTVRQAPFYVNGDSLIEGNETIDLELRNLNTTLSDQVSLGTTTGTVTIDDNDTAMIEVVPQSLLENGGVKPVQVRLRTSNGEGGRAVFGLGTSITATVTDTRTGTATSATDYNAVAPQTIGFATGDGNGAIKTFNFTPRNDTLAEAPETVVLHVSINASLDGQVTAAVDSAITINDDEVAIVSVQTAEVVEGNLGTRNLEFTVLLTGTVDGPISFDFETVNGTAVAPTDFTARPRTTQSFATTISGATSIISVAIMGDQEAEFTETFELLLSNLTSSGRPVQFIGGATSASATGRIINDELALRISVENQLLKLIDPETPLGRDSNVTVSLDSNSNQYVVRAASPVLSGPNGVTAAEVRVPVAGIVGIFADLGGGNDVFTLAGILVPASVLGGAGHDVINGGRGNDNLNGGGGDDILNGGEGNDILAGASGNDVLNGGLGNDQLRGQTQNDVLDGGLGIDVLDGGAGENAVVDDVEGSLVLTNAGFTSSRGDRALSEGGLLRSLELRGGAGDDVFNAAAFTNGRLVLKGGAGNDALTGGSLDDLLLGGEGNDVLQGGNGQDFMQGGAGDDIVRGQGGNDTIGGGLGNDRIEGGADLNTLQEEANADITLVSTLTEIRLTGIGTDSLLGPFAGAILIGGPTANRLDASLFAGPVTLLGAAGNDVLIGSNFRTVADGGEGNDTITGGATHDVLSGGSGNDVISGGDGRDTILGGEGNDTLNGGSGLDVILGEGGDDSIIGGKGLDRLFGGGNGIATSVGDVFVTDALGEVISDSVFFDFGLLVNSILRLS